jgi:hypothetical protein
MLNFNYAHGRPAPGAPDPEYDVDYWQDTPPITARGNLTFLKWMDLIEYMWVQGNPEIVFAPEQPEKIHDPEKGYILYALESRVPKEGDTKPRHRQKMAHPDDPKKVIHIWGQTFQNIISFSAVHKNPRVAEEIIEHFEDTIIELTPVFIELGLQGLFYARRTADTDQKRFGQDVCVRTLRYMAFTEKLLPIEQDKLETVVGEARIILNQINTSE